MANNIYKYLFLRDELKLLSKLQALAGNSLCGAVCTDCFEKCTKATEKNCI